jgi:hypothetical protein
MADIIAISILIALGVLWAILPELNWASMRIRSRFTKPKKPALRLINGGKKKANSRRSL